MARHGVVEPMGDWSGQQAGEPSAGNSSGGGQARWWRGRRHDGGEAAAFGHGRRQRGVQDIEVGAAHGGRFLFDQVCGVIDHRAALEIRGLSKPFFAMVAGRQARRREGVDGVLICSWTCCPRKSSAKRRYCPCTAGRWPRKPPQGARVVPDRLPEEAAVAACATTAVQQGRDQGSGDPVRFRGSVNKSDLDLGGVGEAVDELVQGHLQGATADQHQRARGL